MLEATWLRIVWGRRQRALYDDAPIRSVIRLDGVASVPHVHDAILVIVLLAGDALAWQLSRLTLKQHDHLIDTAFYRLPTALGRTCANKGGMALFLNRLMRRWRPLTSMLAGIGWYRPRYNLGLS